MFQHDYGECRTPDKELRHNLIDPRFLAVEAVCVWEHLSFSLRSERTLLVVEQRPRTAAPGPPLLCVIWAPAMHGRSLTQGRSC